MSNKKSSPLLVLASSIAFGLIAVYLSITYLSNKENDLRRSIKGPKLEKIEVVVARENLLRGTKIGFHNMVTRPIPYEYVHPSAITLNTFDEYDGKILTVDLPAGKALLSSFVDKLFPKDFSDIIPLKRRALTIQVDEINSIAGLIRPGNYIDLFALMPPTLLDRNKTKAGDGSAGDRKLKSDIVIPVLQNLEVLAIANRPSKQHEEDLMLIAAGQSNQIKSFSTITVNVTPREAALLVSAQDKGDLIALLRNRNDKSGATFSKVSIYDLVANANKLAQENKLFNEKDSLDSARMAEEGDLLLADGSILKKGDYTLDKNGNIVTKDGQVISKYNVTKLEADQIVTSDGKILKDKNLIVKDGVILTKDGIVLSGRGLSVNDKGELVDKDGNVIDSQALQLTDDGSLITKDGVVIGTRAAASTTGVIVAEEGDLLLADGTILKKGDYSIDDNGNIVTKDGKVINKADITELNAGQILTKDGILIKGDGLIAASEGDIMLADGTILKKDDYSIDENGNIVTKDGKIINKSDITQLKAGQIITKDGKVLNPDDIIVLADGTIVTKKGSLIEGVSTDLSSLQASIARKNRDNGPEIEFLSGGNSENGVSKISLLPVLKK